MTQWHPIFAQLLRPAVEKYYEVQTNLPVGDAPREADFVLLRRTTQGTPPFRGLWRHLTPWNILEFKGPTVSPRRGDVDLLIELGLGIDRRLRSQSHRQGQRHVRPEEVSFWYIANHLGNRFLLAAERKLGVLESLGTGLWRGRLLERLVYLVSSIALPVEEDSVPLHLVGQEPAATERQVVQLVLDQPHLQQIYGGWVMSLHPAVWKELEAMARTKGKGPVIDLRPAIKYLGLGTVLEQAGMDRVIEQVGVHQLIEHVGEKEVIKHIGMERLVANLTPAERRDLKRRLE